jgi:hypothetical protein
MDKMGSLSAGQAVIMAEFFLSLGDEGRFVFEATSDEAGGGEEAGSKSDVEEDAGKGKGGKGKGKKKPTKVIFSLRSPCPR